MRVPRELLDLVATAADAVGKCFDYNVRKGCSRGAKCDKGAHTCVGPGCGGKRGLAKCPNRE